MVRIGFGIKLKKIKVKSFFSGEPTIDYAIKNIYTKKKKQKGGEK